jgi:hypothetical protein
MKKLREDNIIKKQENDSKKLKALENAQKVK